MDTNNEPMTLVEGEEPLEGLGPLSLNHLSVEELREQVMKFRQLRQSPQSMRARIEARGKKIAKIEREEDKAATKALFDDLTE